MSRGGLAWIAFLLGAAFAATAGCDGRIVDAAPVDAGETEAVAETPLATDPNVEEVEADALLKALTQAATQRVQVQARLLKARAQAVGRAGSGMIQRFVQSGMARHQGEIIRFDDLQDIEAARTRVTRAVGSVIERLGVGRRTQWRMLRLFPSVLDLQVAGKPVRLRVDVVVPAMGETGETGEPEITVTVLDSLQVDVGGEDEELDENERLQQEDRRQRAGW